MDLDAVATSLAYLFSCYAKAKPKPRRRIERVITAIETSTSSSSSSSNTSLVHTLHKRVVLLAWAGAGRHPNTVPLWIQFARHNFATWVTCSMDYVKRLELSYQVLDLGGKQGK